MKFIREFFNRQMRNMFLQYRYGETVASVQQIKNSVSAQHDDIKLTEDVSGGNRSVVFIV